MAWDLPDAVPRKMLEMCKDTLRRALARNIELRSQLDETEAELDRVRRQLAECEREA